MTAVLYATYAVLLACAVTALLGWRQASRERDAAQGEAVYAREEAEHLIAYVRAAHERMASDWPSVVEVRQAPTRTVPQVAPAEAETIHPRPSTERATFAELREMLGNPERIPIVGEGGERLGLVGDSGDGAARDFIHERFSPPTGRKRVRGDT